MAEHHRQPEGCRERVEIAVKDGRVETGLANVPGQPGIAAAAEQQAGKGDAEIGGPRPGAGQEATSERRHAEQHRAQRLRPEEHELVDGSERAFAELVAEQARIGALVERDVPGQSIRRKRQQESGGVPEGPCGSGRRARHLRCGFGRGHSGAHPPGHRHVGGEQDQPGRDEEAHRRFAEHEQDHAHRRVEGEDVAEPDQVIMEQPEDQQPAHAPEMDDLGRELGRLGALDHQQCAGAEQQGEQTPHLPVDQDEIRRPDPEIRAARAAIDRRVEIGAKGHGEGDHVDREDAHHRDAAKQVERDDPFFLSGGRHVWISSRVSGARAGSSASARTRFRRPRRPSHRPDPCCREWRRVSCPR